MYLECANPNCNCEYDYGHGRLYRLQQTLSHDNKASNSHGVKHYWLCARCSEKFTVEFHKDLGVLLMQRLEALADEQVRPSYCILQPPNLPEPVPVSQQLLPRLSRSRARNRKPLSERNAAATKSIELMENRKMERR